MVLNRSYYVYVHTYVHTYVYAHLRSTLKAYLCYIPPMRKWGHATQQVLVCLCSVHRAGTQVHSTTTATPVYAHTHTHTALPSTVKRTSVLKATACTPWCLMSRDLEGAAQQVHCTLLHYGLQQQLCKHYEFWGMYVHQTHNHACTHTHTHTHTHTQIRMHAHAHTHTHADTHTHAHTASHVVMYLLWRGCSLQSSQ